VRLASAADRKVPAKQMALYRNGQPLKQEGRFWRIRSGGGDAFASVANEILAFSTDRAKSLNAA
jgi:hypothetical protein